MTIVIRKDNVVATDSLIFNGRPEGTSISYENKIKRNKAGTVLIIYSGNNFGGNMSNILELTSNTIVNSLLDSKLPTIDDLPLVLIEQLKIFKDADIDFTCMFLTKDYSFVVKLFNTNTVMYTYEAYELAYIGGGSDYLKSINTDNISVIDLLKMSINNIPTCNGNINVFDLNKLNTLGGIE